MATVSFSGLASGIDTDSLIKATSDATRQTRVKPNQDKVGELTETNSAFDDLKTKLSDLQSLLRTMTTASGGPLSKRASSTDETVMSASASSSAANGSYTVTVGATAKNATMSLGTATAGGYASATTPIDPTIVDGNPAASRTMTFTVGGNAVDVVMTSTMTLNDFASAFNLATTDAVATVVYTGPTNGYRVLINTVNEGTERGSLTGPTGTASASFTDVQSSAASDASITIAGLGTITRGTNSISDVIPGVTFNVIGNGTSTVTVGADVAATTSKFDSFIEKFNDLVKFIADNNKVERQEDSTKVTNVFAPLSKTRVDDNALSQLKAVIASNSYSGGSEIKIFADLGISTERDGTLKFDQEKFKAAMASEPNSVNEIMKSFADTTALTGGTIDIYVRFGGLIDSTTQANDESIKRLNEQIAEAEAQILKTEEQMKSRFARLESTMSKLQSQQSQLTSALSGLAR